MILKALVVWIIIALAETLHGIIRVRYINRRLGDHRARQIGVATGSLLILVIGWLTVPWIGVRSGADCFVVGAIWVALMCSFDIGLGRFYMRSSWQRVLSDFDPRKGGFLGFGMLVLFFTPLITA